MTNALAAKSARWPAPTARLTTIPVQVKSLSATYAAVTPSALKFVRQMPLYIASDFYYWRALKTRDTESQEISHGLAKQSS